MSNSNDRKYASPSEIAAQMAGIEAAKATGVRDAHVSPGRYILRVTRTESFTSRAGAPTNKIDFKVVRVLPCEPRPFPNGVLVKPLILGQEATHIITRDSRYPDYYVRDTKGFAMACAWGENVTPLDVAELFGPDQGGANILVEVNSVAKGKDTDPKDKHFATILYTRRVPAAEFAKDLSPADKTLLFPEGMLESMIATEAEQAAAGFGPKS
jgi:hypothetical protein